MKSANVFLSQGFSHSDKLLFSEVFLLILIAQNVKTSFCFVFPLLVFPVLVYVPPKATLLVLNLKTRKVKDF